MKTMTATEVARGFRRVLNALENGGEEIVVLRNNQPVARFVPGAPRMTALEVLSDLHRKLPDDAGKTWIDDAKYLDRQVVREMKDPWE